MVRGTGRICSRAYTLRPEIYAHSHIYDLARTWPYHELIVTCVDVLTYSGQGCDARHQPGSHVHCGQKLVVGSATLFLWWRNHFLAKFLPVFFFLSFFLSLPMFVFHSLIYEIWDDKGIFFPLKGTRNYNET